MKRSLLANEIRHVSIGGAGDPRIEQGTSEECTEAELAPSDLPRAEPISIRPSLKRRLGIADEKSFVTHVWEKRAAVHRRRGSKRSFEDLLTVVQLDRLIASRQLAWQSVTLIDDRTADERLLSSYDELPDFGGQSVHVHRPERSWRPLTEVCRAAEQSFARPATSFLSLTPARTRTRGLRWELFDAFILQLEGKKRWRLSPNVVDLPIRGQEHTRYALSGDGPRLLETELDAGDVLYIPRGMLHEDWTEGSHSLHWTLGLRSVPWQEIVAETWRRSLEPLRGAALSGPWRREAATDMLDRLLATSGAVDARAVAEDLSFQDGPSISRVTPAPAYQAGNILTYREHSKIRPEALDRLYCHTRARYVRRRSRLGTMLAVSEHKVWVPRALDRELDYLMTRPRFRLRGLPSGVDAARLSKLADTLCSVGLLEPAPLTRRSPRP